MSDYRLIEKLGQGAMGVVFRARQDRLRRDVAVKFLFPGGPDVGPLDVARFQREVDILKDLSHPHIVRILDAGSTKGKLFYVMELLAARDLDSILKEQVKLPVDRATMILDQLLDALDYVHERGVLHRDIKCANIMVEGEDRAILMDFGLSRQSEQTVLTAAGRSVGTPRYVAPELLTAGEASVQSDLWSLGIVAWRLYSGQRTFDGANIQELLARIVGQDPVPLRSIAPEVPPPLAEIVHRMLRKKPAERWATASQVRQALRQAAASYPVLAGDGLSLCTLDGTATSPELALAGMRPDGPPTGGGGDSRGPLPSLQISGATRALDLVFEGIQDPAAGRSGRPSPGVLKGAGLGLLGITLVLAGFGAGLLGPAGPPASTPESLRVRRLAPGMLAVEFVTAEPARWSLRVGAGEPRPATSPTTRHRFEVPVDPYGPVPALTLVAGNSRVKIPPPISLADAVSRLASLTRQDALSERATDAAWERIRDALHETDRRANPQELEAAVRAHPGIARAHDELVDRASTPDLREAWEEIGPLAGAIATDREAPPEVVDDLVTALGRLDFLDALANHLGRPLPFDVQQAVAPAVAMTVTTGDDPPLASPSAAVEGLPSLTNRGIAVYLPREMPNERVGDIINISDSALFGRQPPRAREAVTSFIFPDEVAPGPAGKRLHFRVSSLGRQAYVRLQPPGASWRLPVRIPNGLSLRNTSGFWLTVRLRGALAARRGNWTVDQLRIFLRDFLRPAFVIDRILIEPVAAGAPAKD